jgi:hypothetical protein
MFQCAGSMGDIAPIPPIAPILPIVFHKSLSETINTRQNSNHPSAPVSLSANGIGGEGRGEVVLSFSPRISDPRPKVHREVPLPTTGDSVRMRPPGSPLITSHSTLSRIPTMLTGDTIMEHFRRAMDFYFFARKVIRELIPMSDQDEIKARRTFGLWQAVPIIGRERGAYPQRSATSEQRSQRPNGQANESHVDRSLE